MVQQKAHDTSSIITSLITTPFLPYSLLPPLRSNKLLNHKSSAAQTNAYLHKSQARKPPPPPPLDFARLYPTNSPPDNHPALSETRPGQARPSRQYTYGSDWRKRGQETHLRYNNVQYNTVTPRTPDSTINASRRRKKAMKHRDRCASIHQCHTETQKHKNTRARESAVEQDI